jgi:hypothetical protein
MAAQNGLVPIREPYIIPLKNFNKRKPKTQVGRGKHVFICPICGKTFVRQWTLQRHMLTHPPMKGNGGDRDESESDNEETMEDEENSDESEETPTHKCSKCNAKNIGPSGFTELVGNYKESSDEKESSVESDKETENGSIDEESDQGDELPLNTINNLLHMVGAAELGKVELTTDALRVFITDEKSQDEENENETSEPENIGSVAIRFLKELLIAAKEKEILLSKSLYSDILDAIDKSDEMEEF